MGRIDLKKTDYVPPTQNLRTEMVNNDKPTKPDKELGGFRTK